ncbi:hypothetical protein D0T84_01180 [Dysgonomonas sp. 521]|uniref:tail fiber protein n=1 Tax=Dysgonomonas sp. 521 TaxID=2302932 RepID=UPI0013D47DC4|nr:tail fiber protein [Dysgonomonas sp. 521]NDV93529.1 hypothetical protein [Dysgonomonas sp. 521]
MDKTNFLAKDDFPAASDDLDRLQNATYMVAALALLGGANYILSGCADDGSNVAPGMIVINGEILPFQGGAKKSKITIQETKTTLEAFDETYPEAYIDRVAVFANEGQYNWADFKQVLTNQELETKISQVRGEPPGMKIDWTGRLDRIPDNYMLADGRIMKTSEYPDLAWFYGKENEESFTLPDLRHMFITGYDSTKTDYDSIGKSGGNSKITLSIEQMPNHAHGIKFTENKWGDNANSRPFPDATGSAGYTAQTEAVGGGEEIDIRPEYYVLAYIIKVKY